LSNPSAKNTIGVCTDHVHGVKVARLLVRVNMYPHNVQDAESLIYVTIR